MVQAGVGEDVVNRSCRAGFRVRRPKYQPGEPRVNHGAGTHHAWLDGAVHGGAGEPVVAHTTAGLPNRGDFGMCRRIAESNRLVEPARDHGPFNDDHRTYWNLP